MSEHSNPKPSIDKNKGNNGKNPNEITLVFVVNGEPVEIVSNVHQHLRKAVEDALKESENEGRPLTDWVLKWNSQILDISKKIEDYKLPEKAELFLDLNAGVGG